MPISLVIAYLALPISIVVLGQGAQLFHFRDTTRYLLSFYLVFCVALLVQTIYERKLRIVKSWGNNLLPVKIVVLTLSLVSMVYTFGFGRVPDNTRPNEMEERGKRQAFYEMTQVIKPLRSKGYEVIGTWDIMVYPWWVNMLSGYSYLPEIFVTTLPDIVVERRLAQYCKLLGMNKEQFDSHIRSWEAQYDFIGECKYNATRTYALSPLSDYEPFEQTKIMSVSRDAAYNYIIPISERIRLQKVFDSVSIQNEYLYRLDIIVLRAKDVAAKLKPPSELFHKIFENSFYQVWIRNTPYVK